MLSPDFNFFEVKKAFYDELGDNPLDSIPDYKQFKRWEYLMESVVDKNGDYNHLNTIKEYAKYKEDYNEEVARIGGNWTPLGPFDRPDNNNGVGRVNVVAFDPLDNEILWVGAPSGGLWKSTNGGVTWNTNTDHLPNLGVSDIAIHPTNPNIMYIGTGDRDHFDTESFGLLKSVDGGINWTVTSLPIGSFNLIHRILLNPNNPNILLVATMNGLYRSVNAGVTWTNVTSIYFRHMEFKPNNPNIVYATTYNGNSTFWKSTNGGQSFFQIPLPLTTSGREIGRIAIGVTPADPNIVYLVAGSHSHGFEDTYKSNNSGISFTRVNTSSPPLENRSQLFYDWTCSVSPTNSNELYHGAIGFYKSTNGGQTWSYADYDGNIDVHVDHHYAGFQPGTSNLFIGSDGGIYKTANSTNTWTDLSDGLSITQYYRLGSSKQNKNLVLCGAQDNGTHRLNNNSWDWILGGDGMECLISHSNQNILFASYQNGNIHRSSDGGNTWMEVLNSSITNEEGAWVTPYIMDPNNSNILYAGYESIWKSTNGGLNWFNSSGKLSNKPLHKIEIAPSNTNYVYAIGKSTNDNKYKIWRTTNGGQTWNIMSSHDEYITSIAIQSISPNILWMLKSNRVYLSTDGGMNWIDDSGALPNIPMRTIVYQKNNADALYIGTEVGIYYRNNFLPDWQPFNTGLPNVRIDELEIHYGSNRIRAATFGRGLWEADLYNIQSNDPICGSQIITCGNTYTGSTINSNFYNPNNSLSDCGSGRLGAPNEFYTFRGTGQNVTVSLCDSDFDTRIDVYCLPSNTCSANAIYTCVSGNDDSCGNKSSLTFWAKAGFDFYVMIHGYSTSTTTAVGNYSFTIDCNANCVPSHNSDCENTFSDHTSSG